LRQLAYTGLSWQTSTVETHAQRRYLLVYSSKISMHGTEKCQCFTAIGKIADDEVYEFEMSPNFKPFRRKIDFYACNEISILPLIAELDFIKNKKSWGYPFRFVFFEIKEKDFNLLASQMLVHAIV
jgi:predicted RNA-binding protein